MREARAPHSHPEHTHTTTAESPLPPRAAAAAPFSVRDIPAGPLPRRRRRRSQPARKDALPSVNAARERRSRLRKEKGVHGRGRAAAKKFTRFPSFSVFIYFSLIIAKRVLRGFCRRIRKHCGRRNENGQLDCERDFQTAFSATETGRLGWGREERRGKRGIGGNGDARDRPEVHFGGALGDMR